MKQLIPGVLLGLALLTGCASHYVIVLKNGHSVVADGKPKLDEVNLRFVYKDLGGRTNSIPSSSVRAVIPSSQMPSK
jgi:hypothetical protein